jgi:hypothetical protein
VTGKTARKAFDQNIVLVDPEMDISSEMCEFMDINESPLVLTVSYLPAEWNMILECGLYSASINGSVKSVCDSNVYLNRKHATVLCFTIIQSYSLVDVHAAEQNAIVTRIERVRHRRKHSQQRSRELGRYSPNCNRQ